MKIHNEISSGIGQDSELYRFTRNQIESEKTTKNARLNACVQSNFALCTLLGMILSAEVYVNGTGLNMSSVEFVTTMDSIKLVGCAIGMVVSLFTLVGLSAAYRAIKDRIHIYEKCKSIATTSNIYKYPLGESDTRIAGMICDMSQPFFFTIFWITISEVNAHVVLMTTTQMTILMLGVVMWPLADKKNRSTGK